MRDAVTLERAKLLRREMTPAEAGLWYRLRAGRFGDTKFRRQTPIGPYIVDFTCRSAMLVVEVDGDTHAFTHEHDARRTAYLEARGWHVVRFSNSEVMNNVEGVLTALSAALAPLPDPLP